MDCIVATAGGIEEDFIKCLAPTFIGSFELDGKSLRENGINRIGNLLVPNDNYCKFENWVLPLLDEMLSDQQTKQILWTPSKIVERYATNSFRNPIVLMFINLLLNSRLGERINDESSIYYWAAKNKIPVFSPALTDGSLGDMMYFHSHRNPGLVVDILSDLKRLNTMAVKALNSGVIIVGGGLIKHHICNANLMVTKYLNIIPKFNFYFGFFILYSQRNGADFSVFLNTASEFDGSDSGARPDEAVSWGKIKKDATPVKIYAEASLVLPLLVGQTFAKRHFNNKKKNEEAN